MERMDGHKKRLWSFLGGGGFGGIIAVKPSCFRLTKRQLAVRRSGPRFEYHAISR